MVQKLYLVLLGVLLSVNLFAGEVVLKNGDRLQGDLVKIQGETLVWASESFGNVDILKSKIADIRIDETVKFRGETRACTVNGISDEMLHYQCEDAPAESVSLLTVESVQPYAKALAEIVDYSGKFALAGVFSSGNEKDEDWDISAEVSFRQDDLRHRLGADYESDSSDGAPADEQYQLAYRLDWFFDERWYLYNDVELGADEPKRIDQYLEYGIGVGVQVWEVTDSALAVEAGLDWLSEDYDPTEDDLLSPDWESSNERASLRLASDFRYALPFNTNLVLASEYLYSLEDSEDWSAGADLGLSVPIASGLFSEYKLEYDYDNLPSGGAKKKDTKITIGIGYQW